MPTKTFPNTVLSLKTSARACLVLAIQSPDYTDAVYYLSRFQRNRFCRNEFCLYEAAEDKMIANHGAK